MGFRFRKSIKIAPGIKVNLRASGVSTTLGKPGASVTIGKRGTRATVGLPGTGLSYTEKLSGSARAAAPGQQPASVPGWIVWILVAAVVILGAYLAGR